MNSQAAHTEKHRVLWSSSRNADGINPVSSHYCHIPTCVTSSMIFTLLYAVNVSVHTRTKHLMAYSSPEESQGSSRQTWVSTFLLQSSFSKHDGPEHPHLLGHAVHQVLDRHKPSFLGLTSGLLFDLGGWDVGIAHLGTTSCPPPLFVQTVTF